MTWGRKRGKKEMRRRYGGFSGRPEELPDSGNQEASERGGWSRNSHGWTPEMKTLQQGAVTGPVPWGRLGIEQPPNISGDPKGYNSQMWEGLENVAHAFRFLGYQGSDGIGITRQFQGDWNRVSQRVATNPNFQAFDWNHVPQGNVIVDGDPGPQTLNALEVAIANQNVIPWQNLTAASFDPTRMGRKHIYSAK